MENESAMSDVFTLNSIGYGYSGDLALRGVDLRVKRGECLTILGANGSGKSTLLKVLNGLIKPGAGQISFYGNVMGEREFQSSAFRSRVGFVFSEVDVQLFSSTVFEEVAFGPTELGLDREEVEQRTLDTLKMLELTRLSTRPPYTLSAGEKKKVAIASVLSVNPEVLLLDEPTNALDPRSQVWLIELLIELLKAKKTIVMATHDLSLAEDLSDRLVILGEDHTIRAEGTPGEILGNKELLLKENLIHEHAHRHGDTIHTHSHGAYSGHDDHNGHNDNDNNNDNDHDNND